MHVHPRCGCVSGPLRAFLVPDITLGGVPERAFLGEPVARARAVVCFR